jgi:hypothetical protein
VARAKATKAAKRQKPAPHKYINPKRLKQLVRYYYSRGLSRDRISARLHKKHTTIQRLIIEARRSKKVKSQHQHRVKKYRIRNQKERAVAFLRDAKHRRFKFYGLIDLGEELYRGHIGVLSYGLKTRLDIKTMLAAAKKHGTNDITIIQVSKRGSSKEISLRALYNAIKR